MLALAPCEHTCDAIRAAKCQTTRNSAPQASRSNGVRRSPTSFMPDSHIRLAEARQATFEAGNERGIVLKMLFQPLPRCSNCCTRNGGDLAAKVGERVPATSELTANATPTARGPAHRKRRARRPVGAEGGGVEEGGHGEDLRALIRTLLFQATRVAAAQQVGNLGTSRCRSR
jgi:hypothetical protein